MALANKQAVQADEAQSIATWLMLQIAQALKRFQQLSWRLPELVSEKGASFSAQQLCRLNSQVRTVQAAEQTFRPSIKWLRQAPSKSWTSANVLTNATEGQGQGKEYTTDVPTVPKCPCTTHESRKCDYRKWSYNPTVNWHGIYGRGKRRTKLMSSFLKRCSSIFNVTEPANALNVYNTWWCIRSVDVQVMVQALVILICHLTQHGSTLKVTTNMTVVDGSSASLSETRLLLKDIQLKSAIRFLG